MSTILLHLRSAENPRNPESKRGGQGTRTELAWGLICMEHLNENSKLLTSWTATWDGQVPGCLGGYCDYSVRTSVYPLLGKPIVSNLSAKPVVVSHKPRPEFSGTFAG